MNTQPPPAEENCSKGIFLDIYRHLTEEQQDMIQWALFFPERAKACYRIPLQDIDLSRSDYAILRSSGSTPNANGIRNKMRVDHPGLVPIDFARRIVANALSAGNNCPFPCHEWLWSQITSFAKKEYNVRLVSNYTRKYFEARAEESTLKPSIAAFLMGDKTKLAQTGHLPLIYNPSLRPMEREQIIQDYAKSGITEILTLPKPPVFLRLFSQDRAETRSSVARRCPSIEPDLTARFGHQHRPQQLSPRGSRKYSTP